MNLTMLKACDSFWDSKRLCRFLSLYFFDVFIYNTKLKHDAVAKGQSLMQVMIKYVTSYLKEGWLLKKQTKRQKTFDKILLILPFA